jgi:hypothetical protein
MSWQIQAGTHRTWAIAFAVALMAESGDLFAQRQPSGDAAPACTAKNLDGTVTLGQLRISAFSANPPAGTRQGMQSPRFTAPMHYSQSCG